jgi:diguanylate cyclase (GGDEF)-like protein/PAS domain S-box-containing protein
MFSYLKRRLFGTLRSQVIVGMAFVVASTMFLFVWDQTEQQKTVLMEQQTEKALALAHSVATSAAVWVVSRDYGGMQDIVGSLKQYPDLRHAIVIDTSGRILAHGDPARRGQYLTDLPINVESSVLQRGTQFVDVVSPVVMTGKHIGWVRIGLSNESLNAKLREALQRGIFFAMAAIGLSMGLAALTGRYLTRRLDAIQRVADAVRAGDTHVRVVLTGDDEAARLAVQFNRMLDSLAQRDAERTQSQRKLQLAASVFTHAREGIMITAADGTLIEVNESFTRITGYTRNDVVGNNPRVLNSGRQGRDFYTNMWRQLVDKGHWYGEIWNRRKNGEVYAEMLTITAVRDAQDSTEHYVALFSDISVFKAHEEELHHIAHYDALTSLPNRVLLADRLRQGMAHEQRRGKKLAVVFLDLDGFKAVNDTHGHKAGDQLLVSLTSRMKADLREGDTLARLGGDEFVAVLGDLEDIKDSVPLLKRLLTAASQPVMVGGSLVNVSASLGVTCYPQSQDVEADQLLRQADQAMYQAKLAGKNRYSFFDAEQDSGIRSHFQSVERIRQGLIEHEFVLYYQPKVNMRTGVVVGVEALIRWHHPETGWLLPGQFLPTIENTPLAISLGEWVIETALAQMQRWQDQGLHLPVSVNVGARQLQQSNFVNRLQQILATHPAVSPANLEIEILETSALEDLSRVSRVIEECRAFGVMFAMDDFGTGYSSLTYLRRLRVSLLKIDQSFVRDMLDDTEDLTILRGVIGLAKSFRRDAIAEGVETIAHGSMLLQLGCELGQGYGIARPMPAERIPEWLAGWAPDAAWLAQAPMALDDVPLLYARVEHSAWIAAMGAHLRGERFAPPTLDQHQCNFGKWFDGEGTKRYGASPAFAKISALHHQVHTIASELVGLQTDGCNAMALAKFSELEALRDTLLAHLARLPEMGGHQG